MMFHRQRQDMRRTLALEDDVAHNLKTMMRKSRKSFKEIVNECLRIGLNTPGPNPLRMRFRVFASPH